MVDGEWSTLTVGESASVPAQTLHTFKDQGVPIYLSMLMLDERPGGPGTALSTADRALSSARIGS
jgi:hypothetical protein